MARSKRRSFKWRDIKQMAKDQNYMCSGCGECVRVEACGDHIFPWSKGGPTETWNLQVLCVECNASKGNKCPIEWAIRCGVSLPDRFFSGLSSFLIERSPKDVEDKRDPVKKVKLKKPVVIKIQGERTTKKPPINDGVNQIDAVSKMSVGHSIKLKGYMPNGKLHDDIVKLGNEKSRTFKFKHFKNAGTSVVRVS